MIGRWAQSIMRRIRRELAGVYTQTTGDPFCSSLEPELGCSPNGRACQEMIGPEMGVTSTNPSGVQVVP